MSVTREVRAHPTGGGGGVINVNVIEASLAAAAVAVDLVQVLLSALKKKLLKIAGEKKKSANKSYNICWMCSKNEIKQGKWQKNGQICWLKEEI